MIKKQTRDRLGYPLSVRMFVRVITTKREICSKLNLDAIAN